MSVFLFLAAFLLFTRIRKVIKPTSLYLEWNKMLNYGMWGVVAVFLVMANTHHHDAVGYLVGSAVLCGVLYYLKQQRDFEKFNFYFVAHYPLLFVGVASGLIALISPKYYGDWEDTYVASALVMTWAWIYVRWLTAKKSQEELQNMSKRTAELDQMVAERTAELTRQKEELEKTIVLLQTTQQQLIQSEKLASLGELTAGIAHEIQNPLNFVNNFADVSTELLDEMDEELTKGDLEEVRAIASDIKQNLEKISHHGKRADSIVKGMLQHSRASTGQKEPTDINALADEYLRLAYHGLRAKDKSFNAELVTHFDAALPKVNVIPQDVGRVLLNLFTNAFYATHQKQKSQAVPGFKPVLEVTTLQQNKQVIIKVKDNGTGIPEAVRDKIMQPFFTTKPTGEGTGLGLSLSYDIIVKGHGGTIDVESTEGEGTLFTITLPA